ncbi:MAG: hypothetical protein QOD06_257 [Candidatus Binatota bacterium]|nr:hypothetical protein [Candidatus Binatota bacterium]
MHILFVHQSYASQFAPVAEVMARSKDHRVTFVSTQPNRRHGAIENLHYDYSPDPHPAAPMPWRSVYARHLLHCQRVARVLEGRPDVRPDLVVGHSGLGPTLLIPEVLDCPIVSYFEYFMDTKRNDMLFRTDFEKPPWFRFWRRALNAVFLADLANCRSGYSPTRWQRSLFPKEYRSKLRVLFDGIDTAVFRRLPTRPRQIGSLAIPDDTRIVTYASRGMESMRGFDVFMKVAKRIYERYPKVLFVVAGRERVAYSTDPRVIGQSSFKKWVLKQDSYDLSKFRFVGWLPRPRLAQLFNASDLHVYLTTPFPLSWSLFSALACGATVLASDTEPVREVITHGRNGLLADFFDVDGLAETALKVLRSPSSFRELGRAAATHVQDRYGADAVVPKLIRYFCRTASARKPLDR